jgi:hypothetical protein
MVLSILNPRLDRGPPAISPPRRAQKCREAQSVGPRYYTLRVQDITIAGSAEVIAPQDLNR